jgi:DNA repair exonuclease SbcCD ATPase subunit
LTDHAPEQFNGLDSKISVRGYFERVLKEFQSRLDERISGVERYFTAILEEQRRGMVVAEQEREKAASALRAELERMIAEGDRNLRDHITNQIAQIRAALTSAEKLEVERQTGLAKDTAGVRRELGAALQAAQKAVDKAEEAIQARLELLNEFRAQIADESRKYAQREVVESQIKGLRERMDELTEKVGKIV